MVTRRSTTTRQERLLGRVRERLATADRHRQVPRGHGGTTKRADGRLQVT